LNWLEAKAKFEAGAVVVIPIGAIAKKHRPHLPPNTDWLIARELARRVTDYGDFLDRPAGVFQRPGVMTVSRSGAFRDPTLATQEKGEAILAAMSQDLVLACATVSPRPWETAENKGWRASGAA
jgi:creatinine amidohydrolase/Fe(II)-dependent formamide hydrolase-like protein